MNISLPTQAEKTSPLQAVRDVRLDFFRGLALFSIFLDHIPANVVNWVTIRNFGFSDAAEAFVFMAGYSAVLAYGGRLRSDGFAMTSARILKRCWQLYVAQLLLFVAFTAEISNTAATFNNPMFSEEMGIASFLSSPHLALMQAMLLKFRPANMDILPLYIVLLAVFPLILLGLQRRFWAVIAASVVLYFVSRNRDWNLPIWPNGQWLFNPFCWQLLFIIGAAFAVTKGHTGWMERTKKYLMPLSIAFLAFAFFIVMSWDIPILEKFLPEWLETILYPIDKGTLDPLRLIHFFALTYLVLLFVPPNSTFFATRIAQPVIRCGQHPLEIFCLGLFLSFTGHMVLVEVNQRVGMQIVVSLAGIAIMIGTAYYLAWFRRTDRATAKARAAQRPEKVGDIR